LYIPREKYVITDYVRDIIDRVRGAHIIYEVFKSQCYITILLFLLKAALHLMIITIFIFNWLAI